MTLKSYVIIGAIIVATPFLSLLWGIAAASDEDELTEEQKEIWNTNKGDRPAINPDFNPDYGCLFDVYQIQCIPGSAQECPRPQ